MKDTANTMVAAGLACFPALSHAQVNELLSQSVPTLNEVGLIGLVALLGFIAGWIIKRNGK